MTKPKKAPSSTTKNHSEKTMTATFDNQVHDIHSHLCDKFLWDEFHPVDWSTILSDDKLERFLSSGFVVLDNVFANDFVQAIKHESQNLSYNPAKLTKGERLGDIRGDSTYWLHEDLPIGKNYLNYINTLAEFFNRTFFAGIRRCEAHYANYPPNTGYDWHKDNPTGRDERVISAVFYLNEAWQQADGGCLELIDKHGVSHTLEPIMGRLVIFDSNLSHRVQQSHKTRYSIATWLRKDE